jgi:phage shock protein PspC (stress-responsive transcriptional regulator)
MKKTISINIASTAFHIDEDAYGKLQQYLKKLEAWFGDKEGGREIINDIESRLSELFAERINPKTGVITVSMVEEVTGIMGEPEDFMAAGGEKAEKDDPGNSSGGSFTSAGSRKRLHRDIDNKVLGGVCSGIAAYFNMDPVLVRVIFAILPFLSFGVIIPIYIVLWIAVPAAITTAQRLEMRGEDINISNIEKTIKDQYENVRQEFSKFRNSSTYREGEEYFNRFSKRDRNVLLIVGIVVGLLILSRIIFFSIPPMHMMHFPFFHFSISGIMPLILILLILGLIFRSAFKGFLILIAVLILLLVLFKIISAFTFFPWFIN